MLHWLTRLLTRQHTQPLAQPGCWWDDRWKVGFLQPYGLHTAWATRSRRHQSPASSGVCEQSIVSNSQCLDTEDYTLTSHGTVAWLHTNVSYFIMPHSCGICFCQQPFIGWTAFESFIVQTWLWPGWLSCKDSSSWATLPRTAQLQLVNSW